MPACPRAYALSLPCPHVTVPTCPLTLLFLKQPPPLHPTPPQQPQPFRVPGKAEGQADDNQRQARRQGQGNGDQARDDQNRPRDHPGRLDNTEHTFKVTNSPTKQATPSLLWVGASPRAALALHPWSRYRPTIMLKANRSGPPNQRSSPRPVATRSSSARPAQSDGNLVVHPG